MFIQVQKYAKSMLVLLAMILIVSCSDDATNPVVNKESETLVQYLEANGDYLNTKAPALITAADLQTKISGAPDKVHVIDIRDAATFAKGHITGSVNVTLANLLTYCKSLDMAKYDVVAIACFSGQTACFGTTLMRTMGYDKVVALKFGMAAWHSDFSPTWDAKISNAKITEFVNSVTAKSTPTDLPVISTGKTTGKEILEARINALLLEGFTPATVTNDLVFTNKSTYYIVNYWPEAQYLDPGHIPTATNYIPKVDLKLAGALKTLPTNKPIALYCYTGMTSAATVAYLRLLGYDAKSILYGCNAMIYDAMKAKGMTTWTKATECKDYILQK